MKNHSAEFSFLSDLILALKHFLKTPSESIYKIGSDIVDSQLRTSIINTMEYVIDKFNTIMFIYRKTLRTFQNQDQLKKYESEAVLLTYFTFFSNKLQASDFLDYFKISRYPKNVLTAFNLFFQKLKTFSFDIALKGKTEEEIMSIRYSYPSFFINKMISSYGREKTLKEIEIMNSDEMKGYNFFRFRVPSIISEDFLQNYDLLIFRFMQREKINEVLKASQIEVFEPHNLPFSVLKGWTFRIKNPDKSKLLKHNVYNQNKIVFQDLSSIVAVIALDIASFQFVYDMCAAPTIKTDLINQLSLGRSTLIASDFSHSRLKDSYLSVNPELNVHLICQDSTQPALRKGIRFDRILLDAPCTGSGTFASNPQAKIHQSNRFLNEMVIIQNRLLHALVQHSDENTIVVYSVCSMYMEEGELQIKNFLEQSLKMGNKKVKIMSLNLQNASNSEQIDDKILQSRIFPSAYLSSGFYVCKFGFTDEISHNHIKNR